MENGYWGYHLHLDMASCNPEKIRSAEIIKQFAIELCDLIEMKRFGEPVVVNFGEDESVAGYSLAQLIETSLVSGHFVNLTNDVYLDIFSCKPYDLKITEDFCKTFFEAKVVKTFFLLRQAPSVA